MVNPTEELYDLMFDPNERNNLVEDPLHIATQQAMKKRLDDWMVAANDPLLHGRSKHPSGADNSSK